MVRDGVGNFLGRLSGAIGAARRAVLRRRGFTPAVVPYVGYGTGEWVRVLGRVVLVGPGQALPTSVESRGWRTFLAAPVPHWQVELRTGGAVHHTISDDEGYIDVTVPAHLPAGWQRASAWADGQTCTYLPLYIVDGRARLGVISDIDDTVLATSVPRPLLAAYNMFIRPERERRPIAGMPELFAALRTSYPTAPVFYVSAGAWNQVGLLGRFLARHGYPAGPLLLTDFGLAPRRWLRHPVRHKQAALAQLAKQFPHLRWVLIGDDGQADPAIYRDFARAHPGRVRAIAIRHIGPGAQVLSSGVPVVGPASRRAMRTLDKSAVRFAVARTGHGLAQGLGLSSARRQA